MLYVLYRTNVGRPKERMLYKGGTKKNERLALQGSDGWTLTTKRLHDAESGTNKRGHKKQKGWEHGDVLNKMPCIYGVLHAAAIQTKRNRKVRGNLARKKEIVRSLGRSMW